MEDNMHAWPLTIRLLHAGLAFFVTIQLLTSQLMDFDYDKTGITKENLLFEIHEYSGLSVLIITVIHVLIVLLQNKSRKGYFPWSGDGFQNIKNDLRSLMSGNLPKGGYLNGGLAGFVHGLGLLIVLAAASFGTIIFIALKQTPVPVEFLESFIEGHEVIGSIVIIYWVGHVSMAIWHYCSGDKSILDVFSLN